VNDRREGRTVLGDDPHWYGLSVPLIVGFNVFASHEPRRIQRPVLRIGLEWAGGVDLSTAAFGWHLALSLGIALM
jgi:hypothetical protein